MYMYIGRLAVGLNKGLYCIVLYCIVLYCMVYVFAVRCDRDASRRVVADLRVCAASS